MLQRDVEGAILDRHRDGDYVFPAYEDYSFANVNPTLLSLLVDGADEVAPRRRLPEEAFRSVETAVDRVVLVFLDGYGWEHWKRDYAEVPLLSALTERGSVTPLTSIYPSETAAATTTFHTGRTPVEHGLLGWWQYVEEVDGTVQSLPFATLDGEPADAAFPGLDPGMLFEGGSLYERAAARGVESSLHRPFDGDDARTTGAATTAHQSVPDLERALRRDVESTDGPDFVYGYVPNVDAAAHDVGTTGDAYHEELASVAAVLREQLVSRADPADPERTLLALVADHGIVDTPPAENVDLRGVDPLWENLRQDGDGDPIPPVGSPRNCHLFLRDGTTERVRAAVESRWPCRTYARAEAVERGLFGDGRASDTFRRRCGDLVVVHRDRGLWWDEAELELAGMHGGLTREEMLVPFATATLADLTD
ncbi:MAG: alkaline phosphatase family protein [Haloarculaceae archaeon]